MNDLLADGAQLERVFTGAAWSEGPVWLPGERAVRWSDIPNDRILQFDPATGQTHEHRTRVEFTNGRTLDLDGSVLQCSHGRRSVEREVDGVPQTLVDMYEGVRLNSPNDIVVASDGAIWFTDPPYGIFQPLEGHPGVMEYAGSYVFRFVEATAELRPVILDLECPNGLAFSPDEGTLYVSDSGAADPRIWAYDVQRGAVSNARPFARPQPGFADGFRVDAAGRLWSSAGDAVHVFAPDGAELLTIPVPEVIANLCFGGEDGRDLYITATTSVYRIRTATSQAPRSGSRHS